MPRKRQANESAQPNNSTATTTSFSQSPHLKRISSLSELSSSESDQDRAPPMVISEADQRRLIEETGIMQRVPLSKPSELPPGVRKPLLDFTTHELNRSGEDEEKVAEDDETDTLPPWVDKGFDTILYTIPFTTVFLCLDVAIHAQYGQPVTFATELNRLKNIVPASILLIHYTLHHPDQLFCRLLLFSLSTVGGSYMIYVMNKLSYLLVMKQTPSLGALWIYSVVRMELSHAVFSLVLVGLWCWVMNLTLLV